MKISVIIPTYKPADYIRECLNSLEGQTLAKDQYEVIVILNGCCAPWKQRVVQMLEGLAMTSRLVQTDTPGVSNARNIGIEQAKGEFLVFVDDDDWVSKNFLRGMLNRASESAVVTSTVVGYRDEASEYINDYYLAKKFERIANAGGTATTIQGRSFLSSSCFKLIPRDVIGNRRFDLRYKLGEDALFMASITDRLCHVITSDHDAVYYRRLRETSVSHTPGKTNSWHLFGNACSLSLAYAGVYLRNPFQYNVLFFATRILAGFTKRLFSYK